MVKKKRSNKSNLVLNTICSFVSLIGFVGYFYLFFLIVKAAIILPTEKFTTKFLFMLLIVLLVIFKLCNIMMNIFVESLKNAKEAYKNIKED